MAKRAFDVEIPDGQHLAFSRDTDGAFRAQLRDDETNKLVGHAELFEREDDEADWAYVPPAYQPDPPVWDRLTPEEREQAAEALVDVVIILAAVAVKLAPHVHKWLDDDLRPAVNSGRERVVRALKSTSHRVIHSVASTSDKAIESVKVTLRRIVPKRAAEHDLPATDLPTALEEYRAEMSSKEARERFVAAVLAKAFSDQQMKLLSNVTVILDERPIELREAIERLTPRQVQDTLASMLEKNPLMLEHEFLTGLGGMFRGITSDGSPPLRIESFEPRTKESN